MNYLEEKLTALMHEHTDVDEYSAAARALLAAEPLPYPESHVSVPGKWCASYAGRNADGSCAWPEGSTAATASLDKALES